MALTVRTFLFTVLYTLAAVTGFAQQVNLSMGSGSGAPGSVVNVDLTLTSSGGAQPTGLQWKLTPGSGISSVTFTPSAASTLAGKSVTCANNGGVYDCILYGINTSALSNGVIATAAVTISSSTAAASAALALSGAMASGATGTAITGTASSGSIAINQPIPTFTLSGTITNGAGATVALSGAASRTTTANSSGAYSFTGLVNGNYTVTPTRAGYTMSPTSRAVTISGANATANFTAAQQTFTISGTITNGASATVSLSGAASQTTTANSSGAFSFTGLVNGSYTVSPTKAGFTMSPASQAVTINNNSATANFSATQQTWTLSGTITNGANATVTLSGAASRTATANGSGAYSFTGLVNGSYTVTPTRSGYTMSPASQAVTINNSNGTANFTAAQQPAGQVTLSMGSASGAPGATVNVALNMTASSGAQPVGLQWKLTPGAGISSVTFTASASVTNAGKSLQCANNGGSIDCVISGMNSNALASGVVATAAVTISASAAGSSAALDLSGAVASSAGATSIPVTETDGVVTIVQAAPTFTISGVITGGSGATVTLSGAASRTTTANASGNYSFTGLANGSYTVTPSRSGLTFTPPNRAITVNGANQTANFTAVQQTWGISGVVTGGASVTMTLAGPVNLTTTTDTNGNYSFAGLTNGSYTLTPSRSGSTFTPANRTIAINGANQTGVNFTAATQQTRSISGTITGGAGASVSLSGAASKTTTADSAGNYTFSGLANGAYTVTPTLANKTMTPASRNVTISNANVTGTNFTATTTTSGTPAVDVTVSRNYNSSTSSLTSPTFTTRSGNELLLALISTDDARSTQTVRQVSGGGLSWRIAVRTNRQGGTSEIWYAYSSQRLTSVNVTASLAQRSEAQITIMSFSNVDTRNSGVAGVGAVVSANASSGAPAAAITPTRSRSIIVGVGNDPRLGAGRIAVSGQTLIHQHVVSSQGTMWVQKIDNPVETAGVGVVLRNSYPTWSSYNYSAIEIRGADSSSAPGSTRSEAAPLPPASSEDEKLANAGSSVALVHPATFQMADVCSPGGLVTLLGTSFTRLTPLSVTNAPLPAILNGVRVTVNGQNARLMLVSPSQINFQCPDLAVGTALDIAVLSEEGEIQRSNLSVMQTAAPALFTRSESTQAVVQRLEEGNEAGPVQAGDRVRLFLSGLGSVKEPVAAGEVTPADRPDPITNSLTVVVRGVEVTPVFAGLAPGTVGLYQVDVQLPESLTGGPEVPVSVKLRTADGREFLSNLATLNISRASRATR